MSLEELIQTLSPMGFLTLMSVVALLFGLFLGWCLWWWRSRQWVKTKVDLGAVESDVNQLREQNMKLEADLASRETTDGRSEAAAEGTRVSIDGADLAGRPLKLTPGLGATVNWQDVDGVSPELANELQALGVQSVDQLNSMSSDERRIFESKLATKGMSWDWGWLSGWKTKAAGAAAAAGAIGLAAASRDNQSKTTDTDSDPGSSSVDVASAGAGGDYSAGNHVDSGTQANDHGSYDQPLHVPAISGPAVDWSKLDGMDPNVAMELKRLGVENIEQLEALSPEGRGILESKLSFAGQAWDWSQVDGWKTAIAASGVSAAAADAAMDAHRKGGTDDIASDESGGVSQPDSTSPARFLLSNNDVSTGWYSSSAVGRRCGVSGPPHHGVDLRVTAGGDGSASLRPHLNLVAGDGPEIDWQNTKGIDPAVGAELQALGVRNLEQLESLSSEDRAKLEAHLSAKGLRWDWSWLVSWKTAAAGLAATAVAAVGLGSRSKEKADAGWSKVDGVDDDMASELEALGVKNATQLEEMSDAERQELNAKLESKGHRWRWLDSWKSPASVAGAAAAGAVAYRTGEQAALDEQAGSDVKKSTRVLGGTESGDSGSSLGWAQPTHAGVQPTHSDAASMRLSAPMGPEVDWSTIDGVDPRLASELDASGIKSIDQLESLSDDDRRKFEDQLASKGIRWDWSWLTSWKRSSEDERVGAVNADTVTVNRPELNLAAVDGPEIDWQNTDGVDPAVGAELKALGVKNLDQLKRLSPEDRQKVDAHLAAKGLHWDWGWLANWKTAAAGLAAAAAGAIGLGAKSDDRVSAVGEDRREVQTKVAHREGGQGSWANIEGVDDSMIAELAALGVADAGQLESMSSNELEELSAKLQAKGHRSSWLANWRGRPSMESSEATSTSESGFGTATVTGFAAGVDESPRTQSLSEVIAADSRSDAGSAPMTSESGMPILATGVPTIKDDLTLLDGIDGPQAMELHRMGIHNFDQLHDMSADDRVRLQKWFRQKGWYLDMDQWRIASEGNTLNPSIEDIQKKAYEVYLHRERHGNGGGERTDWEQAEWELRGNPIFGYGVPHDVDDYAVSVTGITPEARDELYRMGLYNSWQVQGLDTESRRLLARWFAGPRFGVDLTMAFGWLSSLKSVPQDKDYGHVFANRPEHIDDLSDINGVGPATERDLNRIGIYQFSQIASWNDHNIQAISETLDLGNRINEDMWVVQAHRLSRPAPE